MYHSSVTGRGEGPPGSASTRRREGLESSPRLAADLELERSSELGEAAQGGTPVAGEKASLNRNTGGFLGERIGRQPSVCQRRGIAPVPPSHRLPSQGGHAALVDPLKLGAGSRLPTPRIGEHGARRIL